MRVPRILRTGFKVLGALVLLLLVCLGSLWIYFHPGIRTTPAVVYGHRHRRDLTLDVLQPAHPNGIGILLMVSGGWKSHAQSFLHHRRQHGWLSMVWDLRQFGN